ncbi:MAG: hypothetical protein CVU44_13060 [Chloroflexi bacterium HGW-Chloroflexi-6]|nr:MAG: hypothetical protein CVU44_13060 [Chloroflexi bacterium HGW-Chloroflexi-6]
MRYDELSIQTHREAPANARSAGQSWLVRAGYVSHSGQLLPLGERALARIRAYLKTPADFQQSGLLTLTGAHETYYPTLVGSHDLLHCPECGTAARAETAQAKKAASAAETSAPPEKVLTPDCPTIESLATFLGISTTKTAKALMFVSIGSPKSPDFGQTVDSRETFDSEFIFVVIRGDMAMSEAKLEALVGKFRLATEDEIRAVGAVPGYASPIGVRNATIIVDELIPQSANLVAGANQAGYHLLNTNYGRDYSAEIVADLTQANPGEPCIACAAPLQATRGWVLVSQAGFDCEKILFALAEAHNDEKGFTFPAPVAPFDIYLMQVPGKTLDTLPVAEELYQKLQAAGFSVLFDDRNDRAGVKFNDADLLGCPIRITVGERGLQNGMVEVKGRRASETQQVVIEEIVEAIRYKLTSG